MRLLSDTVLIFRSRAVSGFRSAGAVVLLVHVDTVHTRQQMEDARVDILYPDLYEKTTWKICRKFLN